MARPTSVEPVNATLSTSGWATSAWPVSPAPVTMLTTPGGRSACWQISAKSSAVSGVVSAGLSTTVLPQASAGSDLPGQHQQREVPRDDLAGDAERRGAEAGVLELVGPAGVVEEVRRRDRDVDVAGLLDRLAVVDRLEHGELAGALLDDPGDPEEVLRPLRPRHPAPDPVVGAARGLDGRVDVGVVGLGDLGQHLLGGRVDGLERRAVPVDELAVDEQAVGRLDVDDRARLGGRGVLERGSAIGNQSSGDVVGAAVAAGGELAALHQQVVEQGGGAEAEPVRVEPVGAGDLVDRDEVLDRVLGGLDATGGLDADHLAGGLAEVADGLEHDQRDRQGRGRLHLAGRGLDEVAAGQHREPGRPADVVVGLQLAGLHDHLEVRTRVGAAGLADRGDLLEHLRGSGR